MNEHTDYDYLIIGQGLAGSLLAWQLISAKQRVMVVDNNNPSAASRIAAGIINPVTGMRLVKEARAETYLAAAREVYIKLSRQFDTNFLHQKTMLRLLNTDEIKKIWKKRKADNNYQAFIGSQVNHAECGYECGGFVQEQTAYLSISLLLSVLRTWLEEAASLLTTQFDYRDIQMTPSLHWRDIRVGSIIFCEGAKVAANPWFNTLPMQAAQGEILNLQTTNRLPKWIINNGKWLLPLENGRFRIGATHVWATEEKPLKETGSEEAKQRLLKELTQLFPSLIDYELISQQAGIRPCTRDRRPLIGFHPQHPSLAVFNGFGSKGSMLVPYYAQHFADVLLNGTTLEPDVDIKRTQA